MRGRVVENVGRVPQVREDSGVLPRENFKEYMY
jgi:hypothetical protein